MNFELFEKKSENPDFVMTRCAGNVMTACAYAKTNGDIALIYGEAGLGKTAALKEFSKAREGVTYIELNTCDKSPKGVCERILETFGKPAWGVDRKLVNEIIHYLKANPTLIMLDEAQHLNQRALETLRGINDVTKMGLVLCGNPTVYDQMHGKRQAHFAQLYSRIGLRRRATVPTKQEINSIFKKSPLDDDCCELLHKLSLADGGLRNAVKVYNLAVNLAAASNEALDLLFLQSAYEMVCGDL